MISEQPHCREDYTRFQELYLYKGPRGCKTRCSEYHRMKVISSGIQRRDRSKSMKKVVASGIAVIVAASADWNLARGILYNSTKNLCC